MGSLDGLGGGRSRAYGYAGGVGRSGAKMRPPMVVGREDREGVGREQPVLECVCAPLNRSLSLRLSVAGV